MASTSTMGTSHPVIFTTQTPYPFPTQKFMIPSVWKRYQLSQLINKALSLLKPIPFDFLVRGEILRTSLGEWCSEKGIGEEETLEIEYIESVMPPQRMSDIPHEDWVSSVSCQVQGYFLTGSYDGHIRAFDYSQNPVTDNVTHPAPITCICVVPSPSTQSPSPSDDSTHIIASASHDLTAQLTQISLSLGPNADRNSSKPLATMHLHTAPLSSISSNTTGSHLLTSSWDGLIGLWDRSIPPHDEVPSTQVEVNDRDRKKRRRIADEERPKRKAPIMVLKSHTDRVSKVVFENMGDGNGSGKAAYSCGFDSTVRVWDVENGVCTHTITTPEKPFLDLALTAEGHTVLAASTDRTIALYDLRSASLSTTSIASLSHTSTPSCIAPSSNMGSAHQVVSGGYDGVVRLWDLRSVKSAMASFKAWDGVKKVLSVDWQRGVVGVGGEGGLEVWKVGEGGDVTVKQS